MLLISASHEKPIGSGVSCSFKQNFTFPRPFFSFSDDKLLLQFLVFALIDGILRMSLFLRYPAAIRRGQLFLSRIIPVRRAVS